MGENTLLSTPSCVAIPSKPSHGFYTVSSVECSEGHIKGLTSLVFTLDEIRNCGAQGWGAGKKHRSNPCGNPCVSTAKNAEQRIENMKRTKIEWCDSTWNPVTGCYYGCAYCYARRIAERFGGFELRCGGEEVPEAKKKYGKNSVLNNTYGELLHEFSKQPMRRTKAGTLKNANYPYNFDPTLHRYRLGEFEEEKGRTIFVCSMADLFGAWVPDSWIEDVFAACEKAPQHRYLFLTKNPQRYGELAKAGKLPTKDNMWYGTTATAPDEQFFWGGAWHTFVSIEPILRDYTGEIGGMCDTFAQWVIVGAETGKRKGKVIPEKSWIEEITKTCIEKNICLFMKDSLIPIVGEKNMRRELPW